MSILLILLDNRFFSDFDDNRLPQWSTNKAVIFHDLDAAEAVLAEIDEPKARIIALADERIDYTPPSQ